MSSAWTDRLRRTVGLRLAVWYGATFVVSTLALIGLTYYLLASSLQARDREIVGSTLREYAARYAVGGLPALAQAVELEQRSGRHERLFVRVIGRGADALFVTQPPEWGDFDFSGLGEGAGSDWRRAPARDRPAVLEIASLRMDDGTVLQVGKSTESRDELLVHFRTVLSLVSALTLLVGLAGGLVVTQSTLRPIRDLIAAVRGIVATGQTDTRVPQGESGDAVDELSGLFNVMLARITGLIRGMREALDDVAHDLRTPMARLRASAERGLAAGDPQRQREALSDCLEESDRVLSMLDTLMDISEAETGTMRLTLATVPAAPLVDEVLSLYEDVAEDKGLRIEQAVPGDLAVRADRDRLRQALANLVDNAVKYTPDGGVVRVEGARDGGDAVLRVRDTGPGIAAEDLPRIWDRLYRADRSRTTRGLGLGLSLVKASVHAQGGRVEASSTPGQGAVFTIHLPAA
jgi:signal transduction histidine kinase